MINKLNIILFTFILIFLFCNCNNNLAALKSKQNKKSNKTNVVKNIDEFNIAIKNITAGKTIYLANGIWKDVELKINATGTKENPIYIKAQQNGKVFFEGQSNIKMGGQFVHLEGIVFKNGYTKTSSVIKLQKDKETPCNNCRVTQCVIDNYNPPERFDQDYWVEIYGKNNRFDHNYLVAKRNKGVTVAVRLKAESDRENFHKIDHNYFGYRPILGSNGGETLRIGTSHYSLSNSNTIVENNYFENCNGELEIISNKSCKNTFKNNTFFECQGTLTMRHGNETLVENNYFFGNRKPNTGGIRMINATQTVKNNYLQGLTGYRFRGALVIMNGVPNSPLNRYAQVINSNMSNNLLINCDYIQLCAGSDEERTLTPKNTKFANNVIYNKLKNDVFTIYDDVSGISFENNYLSKNIDAPNYKNNKITGFENKNLNITKVDELFNAKGYKNIGTTSKKEKPNPKNTGVNWYPKKSYNINFGIGNIIKVEPGENTLLTAIENASSGDVLELASNTNYHLTKAIKINKVLTIKSASASNIPKITFETPTLFFLENSGSLNLQNVHISGKKSTINTINALISTSKNSMIDNYKLLVNNCKITDLEVNSNFNFLKVYKNTFANEITITNTLFENVTGHILNLNKEIEDKGIYNAENVIVKNCDFKNIGGSAIKLYRGGKDESTFGPMIWMADCNLENVGNDIENSNNFAIQLYGVQYAEIENLNIKNSKKIDLHLLVGEPVIKLNNINFEKTEKIASNSNAYQAKNINYKN